MSNEGLKNVVHRRVHLERSQPLNRRERVGKYLEKKADYKKRAERYHKRERLIKELADKTRFRNEDEFNYKMIHGKLNEDGLVVLGSQDKTGERKASKKAKLELILNKLEKNKFILKHKRNIVKKQLNKLLESNPKLLNDTNIDKDELKRISLLLDEDHETKRLVEKFDDKRNVTLAQFKKQQITKVNNIHKFKMERCK